MKIKIVRLVSVPVKVKEVKKLKIRVLRPVKVKKIKTLKSYLIW